MIADNPRAAVRAGSGMTGRAVACRVRALFKLSVSRSDRPTDSDTAADRLAPGATLTPADAGARAVAAGAPPWPP